MSLVSNLGLLIVGQVVGVVAGELLAARVGGHGLGRVHLLDVVGVAGDNDGRNVKVGLAHPATEGHLAEHASASVLATLNDGPVVSNVLVRELDSGVLLVAHNDGVDVGISGVRGEVHGADLVVKSLEGDLGGSSVGSRGNKGHDSSSELHVGGVLRFGGARVAGYWYK